MKKILIVFGTRPEAIKMAPLVKGFQNDTQNFETRVCVTAQHREMLDQVLDFFQITPDYDLNLMRPGQNLNQLTAEILIQLKSVLDNFQPDFVFVHGDTTTSMAAALASFYQQITVCHIEAGLRTYNLASPFPEEMNRQVTARIAQYHFTPTPRAKQNLINEGIAEKNIIVTGNTVIDALMQSVEKIKQNPSIVHQDLIDKIENQEIILITGHRRENHGIGIQNICRAILALAQKYPEKRFIYPVHLNPKIKEPVQELLGNTENILLVPPLAYQDFIWLMNQSKIIITDSGGIQEEAPSLGKPVLVTRNTTERPEALEHGTVILVGADTQKIIDETSRLLDNPAFYAQMSNLLNPYGDGKACEKIINFTKNLNQ
ncbi:UDP-N-acetylglucosamine 2-epimerase (non-hydrolyzing) [Ornithobacterium rhinotracheale]|uniref:non-hydrolyzing UDP-N-acetylglucosamine 2-epimerase n=1 Tax=Ornithobacterium rhinotracheale TaxID=28251 RepID=UPI00129C9C9E|nr:UDP-N-acetylglucosamine 2-epimerase (non-hydrolyzing) [Ornithobacterium rhinotracheale]MRI63922.1 UDP-N-acetylglucosamine 2-epimerase (non-hydrolyzing) [Ornithobacterium rhinotracheale]